MTNEQVDWVKARSQCSVANVFRDLHFRAKADVDSLTSILGDRAKQTGTAPTSSFSVESSERRFEVRRTIRSTEMQAVEFSLMESAILVVSKGGPNFTAIPAIDLNGRCVLVVNGRELESWQVRQMALERLFFSE